MSLGTVFTLPPLVSMTLDPVFTLPPLVGMSLDTVSVCTTGTGEYEC